MEPEQSPMSAPAWMQAVRNRAERQRGRIRTDALPERRVLESPAHAYVEHLNSPESDSVGDPSAPQPARRLREAGLLMHRRAEDSELASGLHPNRRTVAVCGRRVNFELVATRLIASPLFRICNHVCLFFWSWFWETCLCEL